MYEDAHLEEAYEDRFTVDLELEEDGHDYPVDDFWPQVTLNGVIYALDSGRPARMDTSPEVPYVWYVTSASGMMTSVTALPHVTQELDRRMEEAMEVYSAERAMGWDPNP